MLFIQNNAGYGSSFIQAQHAGAALSAAEVDRVVRSAPATEHGKPAVSAICRSLGASALRNPWRCTITYPKDLSITYTVRLALDGTYTGAEPITSRDGHISRGTARIVGCCVAIP